MAHPRRREQGVHVRPATEPDDGRVVAEEAGQGALQSHRFHRRVHSDGGHGAGDAEGRQRRDLRERVQGPVGDQARAALRSLRAHGHAQAQVRLDPV